MRYKIGDRVIGEFGKGTVVVIDHLDKIVPYGVEFENWHGGHDCRKHDHSNNCWWQREKDLTLLVANKIVITSDGVTTTAREYYEDKVTKEATAKCFPEDTFNFKTGAKIAFDRLWETDKRKPATQVEPSGFSWKDFYDGKVCIHVEDKEHGNMFLKYCEKYLPNLRWCAGQKPTEYNYSWYTTDCFACDGDDTTTTHNRLYYAHINKYVPVVEYPFNKKNPDYCVEKEPEFKLGDRIVGIGSYGEIELDGLYGTVIDVRESTDTPYGVRWKTELNNNWGHSCNGKCKYGYGWYVGKENIRHMYYTGNVVCIKSTCKQWTVGEVYHFEDGLVRDNEWVQWGHTMPKGHAENIEQWNVLFKGYVTFKPCTKNKK